jgi:hypothetical protein
MKAEPVQGADVPLVLFVGQGVDWAIEAGSVLYAQLAAEWKGSPPIDIAALWGARWEGGSGEGGSNAARIVVVSTQSGTCAFSSGRLTFRSVDRSKILPLPHIVARGLAGRFIRGVVFSESEVATLVLNPDAFVDNRNMCFPTLWRGRGDE